MRHNTNRMPLHTIPPVACKPKVQCCPHLTECWKDVAVIITQSCVYVAPSLCVTSQYTIQDISIYQFLIHYRQEPDQYKIFGHIPIKNMLINICNHDTQWRQNIWLIKMLHCTDYFWDTSPPTMTCATHNLMTSIYKYINYHCSGKLWHQKELWCVYNIIIRCHSFT